MTTYDFLDGTGPVPAHRHSNGGGWVADSAYVAASAFVGPDAKVYDNAKVCDNAEIYGNAVVSGNAVVYDHASVYGNAVIGMRLDRFDAAIKENTMSEDEAKTKWCPFARISDTTAPVSVNRPETYVDVTRCLGSVCMAWRREGERHGFCGLAGKP